MAGGKHRRWRWGSIMGTALFLTVLLYFVGLVAVSLYAHSR